ncbi:MAG: 2-C-methyl-D-erythritol 4-phosphate cytidylyltransferase [Myxococcales bacterium]|nr:2-C-methyl-D-erythritol 4-phosphate cytidylyltransferase [Myxococcales bacterium]
MSALAVWLWGRPSGFVGSAWSRIAGHLGSALGYPGPMRVAALVLGAGRGERLGEALPKAFVALCGKPLLVRALAAVAAAPEIDITMPIVGRSDLTRLKALEPELASIPGLLPPVVGGAERQDSMMAGLAALPPDVGFVAVHDAARPLVATEAVSRVVDAARRSGAAILAIPVRDTIKRVCEGLIVETPNRLECYAAQTPQVFRIEVLREALEKAAAEAFIGTDDAEIVERIGVPVTVVPGDPSNIKITDRADLIAAERWLRDQRENDTYSAAEDEERR